MTESVRGLVFGSPEYVAIAKRGENTALAIDIIPKLTKLTDELNGTYDVFTDLQRHELRFVRNALNDIVGDEEVYYEY